MILPHTREDAQNMAEYCPPRVPPTIDIHCHVIPEEFWDASDSGNSWFGASLVHRDEYCYIDTDARFAGPVEANWRLSVDDRVSLMDSIGLDVQIVSPPPYFFNYHLPAEEGKQSARIINEGLLKMVFQKPDRFSAFATLPFQNVDYAVQELEWAMASGMKGAELCTHVNGMNYDDESLWPLFEAAEDLGAFLFFHPHNPAGKERMTNYYTANTIGNPLENLMAISSIISGGVLDKFPGLDLCFSHGGGYASFGAPRIDRGYKVRQEAGLNLSRIPSDYLGSLYYDCLTHGHEELAFLISRVGSDRIMLGSDFPFDMGLDSPVDWVHSSSLISQTDKDLISGGNANRVLNLGF